MSLPDIRVPSGNRTWQWKNQKTYIAWESHLKIKEKGNGFATSLIFRQTPAEYGWLHMYVYQLERHKAVAEVSKIGNP